MLGLCRLPAVAAALQAHFDGNAGVRRAALLAQRARAATCGIMVGAAASGKKCGAPRGVCGYVCSAGCCVVAA